MIDIPDSVFPLNDAGQRICPRCRKPVATCSCPVLAKPASGQPSATFQPYIRLEKSGRQGKTVTVIRRLPTDEVFLSKLSRELKTRTGSGGTYYRGEDGGVIEIQGDKQAIVRKILEKTGGGR